MTNLTDTDAAARILAAAEIAHALFVANDWRWAPIGGTVPSVEQIADDYEKFARITRDAVRETGQVSVDGLGRLIVISMPYGKRAATGEPLIMTDFSVETGYFF